MWNNINLQMTTKIIKLSLRQTKKPKLLNDFKLVNYICGIFK